MASLKHPDASRLARLWELRWLARTDLLWLCHNVLDYRDVNELRFGPLLRHMQQFPMPSLERARASDEILSNGVFRYTPWCDPYTTLSGPRLRALFYSRGRFKTTICTVAHMIQWLINFPHIGIGIFFATKDKSQLVMKNSIKRHFQTNQRLRELFPEMCPRIRIMDWGTTEDFTLECRDAVLQRMNLPPRVEPSVKALSLDSSKAGLHFDLIKCSDIVDEKNCLTPGARAEVESDFALMPNLLVRRHDGTKAWIDLEGTFYHPDDLHMKMIREWRAAKPEARLWNIFVRGVFERDLAKCKVAGIEDRKELRFDPDEMLLPFAMDERGLETSTWPEADPIENLKIEEADPRYGGSTFANQRVLDPAADKTSNRPFQTPPSWKRREDYLKIPLSHRVITCDLADTTGTESNPSVITTTGCDRYGRYYVERVQRGKWSPDETLRRIFDEYQAKNQAFVPVTIVSIEDYAYVRGLKPSIERLQVLRSLFLPLHFQKRDRTPNGKIKRIINALVPPYNGGELMFVDPLSDDLEEARQIEIALKTELQGCTAYSTGSTDDILDTLADIYLTREHAGVNKLTAPDEAIRAHLIRQQIEQEREKMLFPVGGEPSVYDVTGW